MNKRAIECFIDDLEPFPLSEEQKAKGYKRYMELVTQQKTIRPDGTSAGTIQYRRLKLTKRMTNDLVELSRRWLDE